MEIQVGSYIYAIGTSNTAGIDWSLPGRVTQYPAIDANGTPRPDWARIEWPGLLGLDQPMPISQLHVGTGTEATDAAEVFEVFEVAA